MRFGEFIAFVRRQTLMVPAAVVGMMVLGGCETKSFLDPGEMLRTSKEKLVVPIVPSLSEGLDEADTPFPSARDVRQTDLKASSEDYVIGRNDLVQVTITEVAGPGVESAKTARVSESGMVSLPLIGPVKASGLTEADMEKAVAQTYRDKGIIQNAQVSVTVIEARQRTFSILGVVGRPGQFQIMQADFRMLDALTLAGDVQVQGIDHAFIIRKTTPVDGKKPEDKKPDDKKPDDKKKPVDPLDGKTGRNISNPGNAVAMNKTTVQPVKLALFADEVKKDEGATPRKVMVDGKWVELPAADGAKKDVVVPVKADAPKVDAPKVDVVKTEAVKVDAAKVDTAMTATKPFEFDAPKADTETEIIRVPLSKLQNGETQYNVVIRPNDTIVIPAPKAGEYYMGGHVQRPGVYSLTGRQITLKQAIISAGMIDPLGWPERTEIIRRLGADREMFVRVNLPKIFAGEQPDFYLRPYDTVNVGTNAIAPFLAAIRGAFRFTYGFGFIYDRNYYEGNNNNNRNTL